MGHNEGSSKRQAGSTKYLQKKFKNLERCHSKHLTAHLEALEQKEFTAPKTDGRK